MEGTLRAGWTRAARAVAGASLLALLASPAGCGDDGPTNPTPQTVEIEVFDFSFQPETVSVRAGDTVRWIQRGQIPHTATSGVPGAADAGALFDEPLGQTGDAAEVTLTRAGTFPYFCRPHPFMTGSIAVTP
jgi:plastocyanin